MSMAAPYGPDGAAPRVIRPFSGRCLRGSGRAWLQNTVGRPIDRYGALRGWRNCPRCPGAWGSIDSVTLLPWRHRGNTQRTGQSDGYLADPVMTQTCGTSPPKVTVGQED